MKLFELFESNYKQSIRTEILDLLTSLMSIGVHEVHMKQVAVFLAKKKWSLTPDQIGELLGPTDFEVEGKIIKRKDPEMGAGDEMGGMPGMPDPAAHVDNMADNQLAKDM